MKRLLTALCLGLMTTLVIANTPKTITEKSVKQYIKQLNTWEMCTYPEYWKASDIEKAEMMKKSSLAPADSEDGWLFRSHYQGHNLLLNDFFSDEPKFETLLTGGDADVKLQNIINQLNEDERKATLVKDCKDWK